jgi:catechol 2,3-dioxygenase-like lactoylglutathione lyase family enzyme
MIKGIHGLFYSSDPDATRAFFRDKVKLPGSDIGQGWWIFDLPEGDLGVHPVEDPADAGGHDVSFYCDDIEGTVRDMKARGVSFTKPIEDHGYGLVTYFEAPGGITVQLYEPRYAKRTAAKKAAKKAPAKKAAAEKKPAKKALAKKAPAKKAPAKKPAKKKR